MAEEKKVKVTELYRHPRSGALIVKFEFPALNYRSNMNFNPAQFEGMTKEQIKQEVKRALMNHYRQVMRQREPAVKKELNDAVTAMEGMEIE